MEKDVVIQANGISKRYRLGVIDSGSFLKKIISKTTDEEEYWALRNVSFDVKRGEVLGIIGKNGAGKSTLLKILSQITKPTTGTISIKGKVASLLEVGTGFHPELSGRDNIFMNGTILGMKRAEIKNKFDEIVDFSGVEKYIDTPVKRYSSGMYVRLAFAVAAHLDPDILVVDEVLAVGDAEFQKKCIGKMQDASKKEGRTVLFVTHNMAALSNLCASAIVLKDGLIRFPKGNVSEAVELYLSDTKQKTKIKLIDRDDRQGEGSIKMVDFEMLDSKNSVIHSAISGQKIKFNIHYKCTGNHNPRNVSVALSITRSDGFLVTVLSNEVSSSLFEKIDKTGNFCCELEKLPLTSGSYLINLIVRQNNIIQDWISEAAHLSVEDGDFYNTGKIIPLTHRSVLLEQSWSLGDN